MPVDLARLTPTHLSAGTTAADVKAAVLEAQAAAATPEDDRKRRMGERSYTFAFRHVDGRGKAWEGTFTSVAPSIRTRTAIGVMRAQLAGGMDYAALDPGTHELCLLVAHLSFALDEKRPPWARDLLQVDDPAVLRALFAEVSEHEATFLGV